MEVALIALVGLLTGHAFAVAYYRFYTDEDPWQPFTHCHECRAPQRVEFFVPFAGYLLHRARCPDCRAWLPPRSLILPLGSAALFAASYFVFDDIGGALLAGFFCAAFLTLTLTDLQRHLLPNRIVYPSLIFAIAMAWAWPDKTVSDVMLGGMVAVFIAAALLTFSLFFGAGAFGLGDVKLIVLIGFVVGLPAVIVGVLIGTLAAGIASAFLVVTRIRTMKDYIPHGPFLALGAIIALFWGQDLWDLYRGN